MQDEEERPRPDFAAKAPYLEKNPITGIREPSFPKAIRLRRIAAGSGLILLMVCKIHFLKDLLLYLQTLKDEGKCQNNSLKPPQLIFKGFQKSTTISDQLFQRSLASHRKILLLYKSFFVSSFLLQLHKKYISLFNSFLRKKKWQMLKLFR